MIRGFSLLDNVKFINRLSYLIGALSIFLILFSLAYYLIQNWFLIERITIEGNIKHVTPEQLAYIAKNRLKGTLFTLDLNSLQYEFHQVPWVRKVTVARQFPDAITVDITEYQAIGRWGEDGLLSADGRIFSGADDSTNLPIFYANKAQALNILSDYNLMQSKLNEHKINLTKMFLSAAGITKLYFSNNLQVVMCGADFASQWRLLNQYWDQLYKLNPNLTYVNMCYKNAVAINSGIPNYAKLAASGITQGKIKNGK